MADYIRTHPYDTASGRLRSHPPNCIPVYPLACSHGRVATDVYACVPMMRVRCACVAPSCSSSLLDADHIALFLLMVEEGMMLGANGWSEDYDKPLGKPLGPATNITGSSGGTTGACGYHRPCAHQICR